MEKSRSIGTLSTKSSNGSLKMNSDANSRFCEVTKLTMMCSITLSQEDLITGEAFAQLYIAPDSMMDD